ncbi:hypothetical protein COT72_03905 [archaeon CG10_big_fil_rev_8_21_14_0_10_43_11]|nr:MAG: hypothetical protein COT72_03905 [archaeon CG10_big_fil_rev_8_21_14_0_10_43_11]
MKKIVFALALLLFIGAAHAESVSRSISPARAASGEIVTISVSIVTESPAGFALSDKLPNGWSVQDWSVSGFSQDYVTVTIVGQNIDVEFDTSLQNLTSATFSYTTLAPITEGSYSFGPYLYAQSTPTSVSQESAAQTVTVRTITCGDGVCEGSETTASCEADCAEADVISAPVAEENVTAQTGVSEEEPRTNWMLWIGLAGIVVVIIAAALYLYRKQMMSQL